MPRALTDEQARAIDSLLQDIADDYWTYLELDDCELPDIIGSVDQVRGIIGLPKHKPQINEDDEIDWEAALRSAQVLADARLSKEG